MSVDSGNDEAEPGALWSRWSHLWAPWEDLVAMDAPAELDERGERSNEEWVAPVWNYLNREHGELLVEPLAEEVIYDRLASEGLLDNIRTCVPHDQSYKACRRVLEVLDAGNRLGRWRVAIPYVPAPLPPPPASYFQHESFLELTRYQGLFQAFASHLVGDPCELSHRGHWGRVLGTAVLFGGLLPPKWIEALPEAIEYARADMAYLELYTTGQRQRPRGHRRWYPDPLTRMILINSRYELPSERPTLHKGSQIYRLINQFAKETGIASELPRNWSALRSLVATRLALYVPPYVVAYLNGQLDSASVPPGVVERLTTHADTTTRLEISQASSDNRRYRKRGSVEAPDIAVPAQVKSLARQIRADRARGSATRIAEWRERWQHNDEGEPLLASVQRLAEWTEWLFSSRHAHSPVSPNTAYDRYNAIAELLVGQLGELDPAELGAAEDYVDLYVTAIEDVVDDGDPARVRRGLHSFHTFLNESHESVPDLSDSDIFGGRGSQSAPDPNLVDYDAYQAVTNRIRRSQTTSRETARVMTALVDLGLFAGLRRGEAMALRVCDVEPEPDLNVLVRPTRRRRLKTDAGNRMVPFGLLAPQSAKNNLQTLYEERLACTDVEGPSSKAELLVLANRGPIRNNDQVFEDIVKVLAATTDDASIRYHHLRHTFASALLLQLWQGEHGRGGFRDSGIGSLGDLLGQSLRGSEPSRALRDAVVGPSTTQRRTLRAIAIMMGHSAVAVSFAHYIHVTDFIAGAELAAAVPALTVTQMSQLTGYSVSNIYAVQAQSAPRGSGELLRELTRRKFKRGGPEAESTGTTGSGAHGDQHTSHVDVAERLAHAVNAYHAAQSGGDIRNGFDGRQFAPVAHEVEGWPRALRKRVNGTSDRCLDLPRGEGEWALAAKAIQYVGVLSREDCELLFGDLWQRQVSAAPLTLRFHRLPALKPWLRFLEEIKAIEAMQLEHRPLHGSKAGSARTQRAFWEKATGIEARPSDRAPSVRAVRGEIVIGPRKDFSKIMGGVAYSAQWAIVMVYAHWLLDDQSEA